MTPPYKVGLFFVRDSKRRFDYINACQIVADLMVDEGWIEDDDSTNFVPVFLGFSVDKKNPGVFIVPLKNYAQIASRSWQVIQGDVLKAVVDNPRAL